MKDSRIACIDVMIEDEEKSFFGIGIEKPLLKRTV
jgi:hypothetical protein